MKYHSEAVIQQSGDNTFVVRTRPLVQPQQTASGDVGTSERQTIEQQTLAEAEAEAMAAMGVEEKGAVVVTAGHGWHPGVVGLVAARLKERYGRPAFAIALEPGSAVKLHLNSSPLFAVSATLRYVAHDAVQRPDGSYAYRMRATLDDKTDHRVGLKGTAKVSGSWVPAIYWMLRRPIAAVRQTVGW